MPLAQRQEALDKQARSSVRFNIMKRILLWLGILLCGALMGFAVAWMLGLVRGSFSSNSAGAARDEETITLTATIDGSDRFIFTGDAVRNEHGRWNHPTSVQFHGVPWDDLTQPPQGWSDLAQNLDLRSARIVSREGRDVIALELTPEGFDLLFADTQMGAGKYSVTIAIPRK